jgi:hypothetical protein
MAAAALTNTQTKVQHGTTSAAALEANNHATPAPSSAGKGAGGLNNKDLPLGDASFLQGAPPATPGTVAVAAGAGAAAVNGAHAAAAGPVDLLSEFPVHSLLQHSSDLQVRSNCLSPD